MQSFSKDLIAASTVPVLLSILKNGPDYGYSIIQKARAMSDGRLDWKEGMLYPVLHKLEGKSLIRSEWRTLESSRRRKYYLLTAKGKKVLSQEVEQWQTLNKIVSSICEKQNTPARS